MSRFSKAISCAMAIFCCCMTSTSMLDACTGIKLVAKDGAIVHGRTLEFGRKIEMSVAFIPRGYAFKGTTPKGEGLSYTAKYAALGGIAFNAPSILDGINEKGLSIGVFYFPGFAGYTDTTSENQSKSLSPLEFGNWVLTQFASVDEVKAALKDVVISPTVDNHWGTAPPPFHYIVIDKKGNGLVIEPINGELKTYENKLGVFTNSPTFDWHMTNLRNYINLKAVNTPPLVIDGVEFASFGQGAGLVGLPGDFTPPSRFVRAAIFEVAGIPVENAEKAVFQAFHILNQFDIPVGAVREVIDGVTYTDFTMFTSVRDPQALKYYFKDYENSAIRVVDFSKFDPNGKKILSTEIGGKQVVTDITKELK